MDIFNDFFKYVKRKKVTKEEKKFEALSNEQKTINCKKVLEQKQNAEAMKKIIDKEPYILPYIIGYLKGENVEVIPLVDIATQKGVSVYDLLDKNEEISNATIVNMAVKNQPEVVFELEDKPQYADLITTETMIEAFVKNPEVMFSDCKALETKIVTKGKNRDGSEATRKTSLRVQLQRALNLYFRPEAYYDNGFDNFAKSIAERISGEEFEQKVFGNKMTTRVTTAANETLKRKPEKGRVVPASTLHKWNNRVMYTIPREARKNMKRTKDGYTKYKNYLLGLLSNPSLNSFTEAEKTRLVKRCVSIVPELYFELKDIPGYENVLGKLTVQLSCYEAFKVQGDKLGATALLSDLSEEQSKKLLAKAKANQTRKSNKKIAKKAQKEETLELKK